MPETFPLSPNYSDPKPQRKGKVLTYANGLEQRIELWSAKKKTFDLQFIGLTTEQCDVLETFFDDRRATVEPFYFYDIHSDQTYLVRFVDEQLDFKTTILDVYDIEITLKEVNG